AERAAGKAPDNLAAAWDLPDWLLPLWQESLGDGAEAAARASQARAPVTLRLRAESALEALTRDGITAQPNRRAARAATVTDGARALRQSRAWADGLVELQDASSQAVVEGIAPSGDGRALDYCAGGGGKALALADGGWAVAAHDADPARMADLPARAARAGVSVDIAQTPQGAFDLVLCDAPCSGSGAWRRAPQGKWALDPARLAALQDMQAAILDAARAHVGPEGTLVYATCSVLRPENEDQVDAFLDRHSGWVCTSRTRWPLDADGDGFFAAHLRQA
ncbi:MAG: RsmB/NOP family class I SAM-dependent RNA methyltransferase, partial [Pseudomonadota bacterium]